MATMEEVRQSIRDLAETQRRGSQEVDAKFKEVAEAQEKRNQALDAKFKEVAEAQEKRSQALDVNFKELAKSLNKFIGDSGRQWGQFIETLASSGTIRLLKERGIEVDYVFTRLKDKTPNRKYEIDVVAGNGSQIIAIEAKKHLTKKDVNIAKKRFQSFKRYYKDAQGKTLYGAMAYLDCDEDVGLYAQKQGFFVFQVTGNSAVIENNDEFKPTPLAP